MTPEPLLFRGREPVRLAFGTSGLRGLVTEITDLEAYINTRGFLDYLLATGDAKSGCAVALAGDLRPSTHSPERSILRAVAQAVRDAGCTVHYCGRIPTPALSAFAFARAWPSIMVTGSHIPFDRNGIKFNKSAGEVLKSDEAGILQAVQRARAEQYALPEAASQFQDSGMFKAGVAAELPTAEDTPQQEYAARYLNFFPAGALAGLRLVVFEHSAVGREVLADILRGLGAQVYPLGRSAEFVALDTEAVSPAQLTRLQQLADEARGAHGSIDAIVSTDGDSDRPLIVGIDEQGKVRFFGGDTVGIITAEYLQADCAAVPVSATDAIELHFGARVAVRRTQIGSPYVIAEMSQLQGERRVGWEANGGFLTGSLLTNPNATAGAGTTGAAPSSPGLQPLPTRDAVLPIVAVLCTARKRALGLPQLFGTLPGRYGQATLIDAVAPQLSQAVLARFRPTIPALRHVNYTPQGLEWSDGKQLRIAASQEQEQLRTLQANLNAALAAPLGCGNIASINVFDGLRVTFDTGDIVHLRPSGNAPQLRVYVVASSEARAAQLLTLMVQAQGIVAGLLAAAQSELFVQAVLRNIEHTDWLFEHGQPAATLATVCGSESAQRFWQHHLDAMREEFKATRALSLHEDLPVNQAFGVLLLWQRLRAHIADGQGALAAFVFGEGTRATPFTETDNGQKPAIASFVFHQDGAQLRSRSMVELAMRYFAPIESHLRRSGFNGLVIKWGDEVQIPTCDLSRTDARLQGADVVRFVSLRPISEDDALNKDWVGMDAEGRITAFIPRRPLQQMRALAERGLLQTRAGEIWGGINLGSIALSQPLLDALLAEFGNDVADATANRSHRPDLDPQFFTALCIAAVTDESERVQAWNTALQELPAMQKLQQNMPDILPRLRRALAEFERAQGRPVRMVGLDLGEVFWGDVGQHKQIFEFYSALNQADSVGQIARSLAGIAGPRDARGNWIIGETLLGPDVVVENSVLIHCRIQSGHVSNSVLIGTQAGHVHAESAFDVLSTVKDLRLAARAGTYKVVSTERVDAAPAERLTTLFLPESAAHFRVMENTDLRDRQNQYERAILGNSLSFGRAHTLMSAQSTEELQKRRTQAIQAARAAFERS